MEDNINLRKFCRLSYKNPTKILRDLREIEIDVALSNTPERVRTLRTNDLKFAREMRQAALFCLGMSARLNQEVSFACKEDQDYDFVATWMDEDGQHFSPVQLKEVVPKTLNPAASIDLIIQKLSKYRNPSLTIAIHHTQAGELDPANIHVPKLEIVGLWIFAAITEDQSKWGLWGDFLSNPYGKQFSYPE